MTPIYLSADTPRWIPKTEADLQAGIDKGLLEESHHLDLKEMPDTKRDNREAARDLASFAVDSGTLIYGVAEDKVNRTFRLASQPLNGLAEKLEQIARSTLLDPPLSVLTDEIPSDTDPTRGYLVVHIPASSAAPHMVDGRYYGRGDKTRHVLSDADVLRLHERRRSADREALALLQHEIDNDPIPAEGRTQAHLFLVAQPLAGPSDMLLGLTGGQRWNLNLVDFIDQAFPPELNEILNGMDIEPTLRMAGTGYRRARGGVARATSNLGDGRVFSPTSSYSPESAIELQVHEDGGLRLFFSRLSYAQEGINGMPDRQVILDAATVSCTRRFIALTVAAAEKAGYFGNWALAFGATGLRGLSARGNVMGFGSRARYDEASYTQMTSVSWAELNNAPGAATRRLVGSFLRSFDAEADYAAVLNDPA